MENLLSYDIMTNLSQFKYYSFGTNKSAESITHEQVDPTHTAKEISAFETFKNTHLSGYVVDNGLPVFFKKSAFRDFLDYYSDNAICNSIVAEFVEINTNSAPTISYYGVNNKKLHFVFLAAYYNETTNKLSYVDGNAYDLCEGIDPADRLLSSSTRTGFQNAFSSGENSALLDTELSPTYNGILYPNTKTIIINKMEFSDFIDESHSEFVYVKIRYALSRLKTGDARYDHRDFLKLVFFRAKANHNEITTLGVYDLNDLCPPKCPA